MNTNLSVHELRKNGYRVYVQHFRVVKSLCPKSGKVVSKFIPYAKKHKELLVASHEFLSPFGGLTSIEIQKGDSYFQAATAECSEKDHFCYKRGVQIALGRAFSSNGE